MVAGAARFPRRLRPLLRRSQVAGMGSGKLSGIFFRATAASSFICAEPAVRTGEVMSIFEVDCLWIFRLTPPWLQAAAPWYADDKPASRSAGHHASTAAVTSQRRRWVRQPEIKEDKKDQEKCARKLVLPMPSGFRWERDSPPQSHGAANWRSSPQTDQNKLNCLFDRERALVANQYPLPSQHWCLELARTGEPHAIEIRPCGSGTSATSYLRVNVRCEVPLSSCLSQSWCAWILWMPQTLVTKVTGRYLRPTGHGSWRGRDEAAARGETSWQLEISTMQLEQLR